jgi:hypothetical protein
MIVPCLKDRRPELAGYIAQKVLPVRPSITYCNSGRTAFYLAVLESNAQRVYLPNFIAPTLIEVLLRFFPEVKIEFYNVRQDLTFDFFEVHEEEMIVILEYFGTHTKNLEKWPADRLLLDLTHIPYHQWQQYSQYNFFGSLRKINKIADGGFKSGFNIYKYGKEENIESNLVYQARTWHDLQQVEELLDGTYRLCDMSSASLSVFLSTNHEEESRNRLKNWFFMKTFFGDALIDLGFDENSIPSIGHFEFNSKFTREFVKQELAKLKVFGSNHWVTPSLVLERNEAGEANTRFGDRVLNIPLGFNLNEYPLEKIKSVITKTTQIGDR